MNTINAMKPAHAHVHAHAMKAAASATPPVAGEGLAGLFLGLLGEAMTSCPPAGDADASGAGESTDAPAAPADGGNVDAATASALAAALAAMQPVMPAASSAEGSAEAADEAIAAVATPVDATAIAGGADAADETATAPVAVSTEQDGGEDPGEMLAPDKAAAAPAPASKATSLESVIQEAAASIGRSTERAFGGRRLDGPAIKGPSEGSGMQAIDGNPAEVESGGFARVVVNAAADAAGQQSTGNGSSGNFAESEAAVLAKASVKPSEGSKTAPGMETRLDFNTIGGTSHVKASDAIAANPAQNAAPDSVSVQDVGDVVVRSVHYLSGKTDEVVTVRLVPRSLGELQIAVRHSSDGVEVVMTVANAAARDALEGHVAGLREALGRDGVEAPRVTIQVASHFDASHQPAFSQAGQQGTAGHAPRQAPAAYREPAYGSGAREQEQQQPKRQRHDGRLNTWA